LGALAASDAAAAAARQEGQATPIVRQTHATTREIVKLLWYDFHALARIRKHPRWRVLLSELELRLLERDNLDHKEENDARNADRRDVLEVLACGEAIGSDEISRVFDAAVDEDGKLEPPLVLVAGDLNLPFDELEKLKATAAVVRLFARGDRQLQETLDLVTELLRTPYLTGGLAENLTRRLTEAFAQAKQALMMDALDAHVDQMLLEQRAYKKRNVYGKRWIRALLAPGTGSEVPVYIPDALAGDLPMFRQIKVRIIAEVDLKEDQSEVSAYTLKVMALGRVTPR
jgi:hypothetical protein